MESPAAVPQKDKNILFRGVLALQGLQPQILWSPALAGATPVVSLVTSRCVTGGV